jgi:hypothetical protein
MQIGARTTGSLVSIRVSTGGEGYTAPPTMSITGGGGTGATGVVVMAGTVVDSVIITNSGTGFTGSPTVSFSGNGGTGAEAEAYAYAGTLRPMSFFKGRFGDLYGVDGMGRGVRWEGGTKAEPIGLHKPANAPVVTGSSTTPARGVASVQIIDTGSGYYLPPTVGFTGGGTPTKVATARAIIANGRVAGVIVTDPGAGYQSPPKPTFTGGLGTGGTFTVGVAGKVAGFDVLERGQGYVWEDDAQPTIVVTKANGLTEFSGRVVVDTARRVAGVDVLSAGTGATTTPEFDIPSSSGTGAAVVARMLYAVNALTVANSGSGYASAPLITFQADNEDPFAGGGGLVASVAAATCEINDAGHITAATVLAGGQYGLPPTAFIADGTASAQATLNTPLAGKYYCAIRYIDATGRAAGGPLPSSISALTEVTVDAGGGTLTWGFTHPYLDDRVTAMELWRTSADQAVLLFRVATIQRDAPEFTATYVDSMKDEQLIDPARRGYGLMPVTLPSGQINARRFEVPPGEFAVGVMFQDRAWYAVDTSGKAPNSLFYSEIDEPESVPLANELVVQENTGTPDAIVALVPLGPALLAVQSAHIYRLMYVAQPVIDASIMLSAYRGVLNNRCWTVMAGVAFLVDSIGMYAFDGNQEQSVSVPVDNFWRDGLIDFSKADKFHVASDYLTKTVRFYYCRSGDAEPTRALCYCTATQAWWEEVYPAAVTATGDVFLSGQRRQALGTVGGAWLKESGTTDSGSAVAYRVRTGNLALSAEPDRAVDVIYKPTPSASALNLDLHYNSSDTPRPNAVQSDRGTGFTVTANGPASLNMQKARPPAGGGAALGDATGQARAYFAGRRDDRSAGGDQHVAVDLSGQQSQDPVTLYALGVRGVQ